MSSSSFNTEEHKSMLRSYFNGQGYQRWASIYGNDKLSTVRNTVREGHAVMMDKAFEWIEQLKLPKGSLVLDAGCGTGLFTIRIAKAGYKVKAADIASQMVEKTKLTPPLRGLPTELSLKSTQLNRSAARLTQSYALMCSSTTQAKDLPMHSPTSQASQKGRSFSPMPHTTKFLPSSTGWADSSRKKSAAPQFR